MLGVARRAGLAAVPISPSRSDGYRRRQAALFAEGTYQGAICSPFAIARWQELRLSRTPDEQRTQEENRMLKFIGGTIGAIFLIGLIVVVLLLMLIF